MTLIYYYMRLREGVWKGGPDPESTPFGTPLIGVLSRTYKRTTFR